MTDRTLGFIGLGNMGGRMARRLLEAGHEVVGFDLQPDNLSASGVVACASVEEVARRAAVILLSLPDSAAVERVATGTGGIIEACEPGQTIIDLTTAAPDSTVRLHGMFEVRGVDFLDAGISGGAAVADRGALTLMVGGSPSVLDRVRWVFEPFADRVYDMGPPGSGHMTKVLNNYLNAVSLASTAEVMVAAKKAGLDLHRFLDVVNNSSGVNFATINRFPKIVDGDYLEGGLTSSLMLKDVLLYVAQLGQLGVPSVTASAPLAAFGLANQLGYDSQISNRVVDAIGDVAGGIRLHDADGEA